MLGSVARQMTLHSIIYKRKKGLLQPAHDGGKPLNQAVSALLPTGNRARTAYLHCIKLSTNIDPACGSGSLLIRAADEAANGITIYGQEYDTTTAGLAKMNLVLHNKSTGTIANANTSMQIPSFPGEILPLLHSRQLLLQFVAKFLHIFQPVL
jgi:hypothetical protein